VGNSITLLVSGQIISVCSSERIIKIRQYLQKLCSNEKGSSFFSDSVYIKCKTAANEMVVLHLSVN